LFWGKKWRKFEINEREEEMIVTWLITCKMGRSCSTLWASEKRPYFLCKLEDMGSARKW